MNITFRNRFDIHLMAAVLSMSLIISMGGVCFSETAPDTGFGFDTLSGIGLPTATGGDETGGGTDAAAVGGSAPYLAGGGQDGDLSGVPEHIRPYLDIALMQYDLGNYGEAEKELRNILKMDQGVAESYLYLGLIYEKKLAVKDAILYYQKALELKSDLSRARESLEGLIRNLMESVGKELEHDPSYAGSHMEMGFLHYVSGDYDKAMASLQKAISLDGELAEAFDYLGLVYWKKGDLRKAYQNIEKAFQLNSGDIKIFEDFKMISEKIIDAPLAAPDSGSSGAGETGDDGSTGTPASEPGSSSGNGEAAGTSPAGKTGGAEAVFSQGVEDLEARRFEDAVSKFRSVLADPGDFDGVDEVNYALARALGAMGRTNQALDIYKSLAMKNHKKGECLFRIALIHEEEGNFPEAHEALAKLKAEAPEFLDRKGSREESEAQWVKNHYWITYFRANFSLLGAFGAIGVVVILLGAFVMILPGLGRKRTMTAARKAKDSKDWEGAARTYSKLMTHKLSSSEKFDAHLNLARSYFELGRFADATNECRQILKLDGNNKFALETMGKSFLAERSVTDEAMNHYRRMVKYDFNNRDLLTIMADHYVRKAANAAGRRILQKDLADPEVVTILKRALKFDPSNRDVLTLLVDSCLDAKATDPEAMKLYEAILGAEPENAKVRKFLARAYLEKGMLEECLAQCRTLLASDVDNMVIHQIFKEAYLKLGKGQELIAEYAGLTNSHPSNLRLQDIYGRLVSEVASPVAAEAKPSAGGIGNLYAAFKKAGEHLRNNEFDEAITLYKTCVQDTRLRKKASINLVVCYIRKGSVSLAYQLFSRINIDADMTNPSIKGMCYDFGRYFEEKGEYDKALLMYDKVCKADIGFKDVFDRFEELFRFVKKENPAGPNPAQ